MERGAIIRTASIAERHPAAPADIPRPIMEITATPPVRGVNIRIRSIAEAKPAPAAVRQPMTMPTTAIPMVHGRKPIMCSTNVRKPVRLAKHPVKNTQTMWTQTAMANVTTAVRTFP